MIHLLYGSMISRARTSVLGLLMACLLAGVPMSVKAQSVKQLEEAARSVGNEGVPEAAPDTARDATLRPLIVVSGGGISKGAYQAGVNWAVLNLLRLQRDGRDLGLDPHELIIATGASAGGVNSLLAAAEWSLSSDSLAPPQNSLYWRVWTTVGLRELLPPCRDGTGCVPDVESALSRRYMRDSVFAMVRESFRDSSATLQRPVATGFMLTEVVPRDVDLSEDGRLTVESVRSALLMQAAPLAGGGLAYEPFPFPSDTSLSASRRGFGSLVHPRLATLATRGRAPVDSTRASVCWEGAEEVRDPRERAEENMNRVRDITLASAAFPYAWAPMELDISLALDAHGWPSEHSRDRDRRWYVDGGVFDNNPLGVALNLREHLEERERKATSYAPSCSGQRPESLAWDRTVILFTDPDDTRVAWYENQIQPRPVEPANAFDNLVRLGTNFLTTGRQYEIESIGRDLESQEQAWIVNTDRAFPIVGSTLGAFGAFLARPFREFDFYVGVYDGYVFAARALASERERSQIADVGGRARTLIKNSGLWAADSVAGAVASRLLQEEFGNVGRGEPQGDGGSMRRDHRAVIIDAILDIAIRQRGTDAWFDSLVVGIRRDSVAMRAVEAMAAECDDEPCDARHLRDLVGAPTPFLQGMMSEVLNFRRVYETGYGKKATNAAMAVLNVYIAERRRGLQVNRSAVPEYGDGLHGGTYNGRHRFGRLAYRLGLPTRAVLSTGAQYATWGASYRMPWALLSLELAPLRSTRVDREGDQTLPSMSAHVGVEFPLKAPWVALGFRAHHVRATQAFDQGYGTGGEAYLRLGHVLSVGVEATPFAPQWVGASDVPTRMLRQPYLTIGLHDVGGLVYWGIRMLK